MPPPPKTRTAYILHSHKRLVNCFSHLLNASLLICHPWEGRNPESITSTPVRSHRQRSNAPTCHPKPDLGSREQIAKPHPTNNLNSTSKTACNQTNRKRRLSRERPGLAGRISTTTTSPHLPHQNPCTDPLHRTDHQTTFHPRTASQDHPELPFLRLPSPSSLHCVFAQQPEAQPP
ncbi:hypothetical protein STSP2_00326 [Anaerohalosphaera lusitana]|uniref:Uncharacterized protein n=1 Tax=Anaerohalosphaera lusitana TaxID=1936003 RepID=A0A1U9NGX3_9BACT|nr:hypothetical protein STSP2_00326 [Anaerohalosphaera lusitana]